MPKSAKPYNPADHEAKIYRCWERAGVFTPPLRPRRGRRAFSIVIPLPNVTGSLHMGHALNGTLQDALIRYHRMKGDDTVWVPGTDHAGIATQHVVEKELQREGKTRHDLGREKFVERVWEWKRKYGQIIDDQLRQLGASCDWTRYHFTMDPDYVRAVQEAFIHYARKGLVYRGDRIINWCVRCASAISDLEVEHWEEDAVLYTLTYGPLQLATVRPETKFGDTGVAVHPEDPRYMAYVGKDIEIDTVLGPATMRVVADEAVDPHFGTGVVKVTPAHDFTDFEIGQRHELPPRQVIGLDGRMNELAGPFAGMTVDEARGAVVEALRKKGLLVKEEPYRHAVARCARCGTTIEPLISKQWFVRMAPLAKPAMEVVEHGLITFHPPRWKKSYLDWFRGVKDWCISRQLWWGHRLPVWYCQTGSRRASVPGGKRASELARSHARTLHADREHVVFSIAKPRACPECGGKEFVQDPDVLDTWFSSALWPFAVFGWPDATADLRRFTPTSVLVTAPDILALWVARMVFSALEFMDQKRYLPARHYGKRTPVQRIPFREVLIHPTVLMLTGERMSKSKGISVDPLQLIERYGADATRFGILLQLHEGQQALRFDENAVRAARNFVNKLWHVGRFVEDFEKKRGRGGKKPRAAAGATITKFDRDISFRLNETIRRVTEALARYQLGDAARALRDFVWDDFADWYVEASKVDGATTATVAREVWETTLRLLHPFVPFVTEVLWKRLGGRGLLAVAPWPVPRESGRNAAARAQVIHVRETVHAIRSCCQLFGIQHARALRVRLGGSDLQGSLRRVAERLAGCAEITQGQGGAGWVRVPTRSPGGLWFSRDAFDQRVLARRLAEEERSVGALKQSIGNRERQLQAMRKGAPAAVIAEVETVLARDRGELAAREESIRTLKHLIG